MTETEFSDLLKRVQEGRATEVEKAILKKWLESRGETNAFDSLDKATLEEMWARMDASILEKIVETQNLASPARTFTLTRIAAAAAILVAALTGLWLYNTQHSSFDTRNSSLSQTPGIFKGKQHIRLPDGSTVVLNDSSSLTYSENFNTATREVTLSGEAYFDIAHNAEKPFIVHSNGVDTRVLGTAFNINARTKTVIVTVTRGKVEVGDSNGRKVYAQLIPNEQVIVNTVNALAEQSVVNATEAIAWKKDIFVLERVTFSEAIDQIAEQYDVIITLENQGIKDCIVNAKFINHESLDEVLTVITQLREATYQKQGNVIVIKGGTQCEE